jgi:predicted ATPase
MRLVLERRLERLDEEARAVLTAAAAIGHSFPFALLQALQDQTMPDDLLSAIEQASAWIPPVAKRGRNCSKATDN